jgi:hypothetical protein
MSVSNSGPGISSSDSRIRRNSAEFLLMQSNSGSGIGKRNRLHIANVRVSVTEYTCDSWTYIRKRQMVQNVRTALRRNDLFIKIIIISTRNIILSLISEYQKIFTVFSKPTYNNEDSTGSDSYSVFRVSETIQYNYCNMFRLTLLVPRIIPYN